MKKKVSPTVKEIISQSRKEALRLGHEYIGTEHLLLGIIHKPDSFAVKVLVSLAIDIEELREVIGDNAARGKMATTHLELDQLPLNRDAEKVLKTMSLEARTLKDEEVCPEHLLMAILKYPDGAAAKVLNQLDVDYDNYKTEIKYVRETIQSEETKDANKDNDDDNMGGSHQQRKNTLETDHFGRDITKLVNQNRQYATIERDAEIQLIAQMLSKKEKNNVLLIGKSGVGKRAIIEEFTYRIQTNSVYRRHFNRVVELDWAMLMMSAKHRGDLEERMRAILDELSRFPKTIILLNQMHIACQFTGKGLFISDILKPALEYGQFKFIGVTSPEKYHLIATDHTINSYFYKLFIEPSSPKQAVLILEHIKSEYEEFHKVIYEKDVIETCVRLTHLRGGVLPGKAADLLDEVAAQVRMSKSSDFPGAISELQQKIELLKEQKNQAVKSEKYEYAADLRIEEVKLLQELELKEADWIEEIDSTCFNIEKKDIEELFESIKKFRQP